MTTFQLLWTHDGDHLHLYIHKLLTTFLELGSGAPDFFDIRPLNDFAFGLQQVFAFCLLISLYKKIMVQVVSNALTTQVWKTRMYL